MIGFRWFPAIIGGLLAGLWLSIVAGMLILSSGTPALLLGWVGLGFWFGRSGYYSWPRVWIVLCLLSFSMPLASLVFSANIAGQTIAGSSGQGLASQAGTAVGAAIGGTLVTGFMAFVGFFLGIIFAILAYVTHNGARERERRVLEVP